MDRTLNGYVKHQTEIFWRDTSTTSAIDYIEELETTFKEVGLGKIASICGRYYAMDRDNKWDRTKVYADLLLKGKGATLRSYKAGIKECYKRDITDEFLPPILIDENSVIKEGDGIFWLNFRGDRARQILNVLKNPEFEEFKVNVPNIDVMTLVNVQDFFVVCLDFCFVVWLVVGYCM